MYKVIPQILKENKIIFLEFLKYWPSSRDFNKLVIKVKIHANYFLNFSFDVWRYNFFYFLRDLTVCMKAKHFIFIFFLWKPGILIPDLYLYSIKIQTNIDQNAVKYTKKSQTFFWIFFWIYYLFIYLFFGWVQLVPCGWAGPSSPIQVTGLT